MVMNKQNINIVSDDKSALNTMERERRMTEKQEEPRDQFNLNLEDKADKSFKSFQMDDVLSIEPYSDYHDNFNDEDIKERDRVNNSMMENLKKHHKKPPIPNIDRIYKNADKKLLNKIQNILKKKDTKKLQYASSEESN